MSIDIEHALLAALAQPRSEAEAMVIVDSLKLHWLECDATKAIITAMKDTGTTDLATVVSVAKDANAFRTERAVDFLAVVADKHPGLISKAPNYVRQIFDDHSARQRLKLATELQKHHQDKQRCAQLIASLEEETTTTAINQIADGYLDTLADREAGMQGAVIKSHLSALDREAPIRKTHTHVVAAQTGAGKSTFALNVALEAATAGQGVLVVSLEMRREELMDRIVSLESGVKHNAVLDFGPVTNDRDRQQIYAADSRIRDLPLHVVDAFQSTPAGVAAQCRKHMRKHPFDLLIVDYLQLLNADRPSGNRTADVASCSRAMKNLANELNIAIVVIAQLNRAAANEVPQVWHLKESSSIEQDASVIYMLHQLETEEERPVRIPTDVIVRKQRSGEKDFVINTWFSGSTCKFQQAPRDYLEPHPAFES